MNSKSAGSSEVPKLYQTDFQTTLLTISGLLTPMKYEIKTLVKAANPSPTK